MGSWGSPEGVAAIATIVLLAATIHFNRKSLDAARQAGKEAAEATKAAQQAIREANRAVVTIEFQKWGGLVLLVLANRGGTSRT